MQITGNIIQKQPGDDNVAPDHSNQNIHWAYFEVNGADRILMHNNLAAGIPRNTYHIEGQVLQAWTDDVYVDHVTDLDIQHNVFVDNHQGLVFPSNDVHESTGGPFTHFTGIITNNIFKSTQLSDPLTDKIKTQHYPALIIFTNTWFSDTVLDTKIFVDCPQWFSDHTNFRQCSGAVRHLDSMVHIANNTALLETQSSSVKLCKPRNPNLYHTTTDFLSKYCTSPVLKSCRSAGMIPYFSRINGFVAQDSRRRLNNWALDLADGAIWVETAGAVGRIGTLHGWARRRMLQSSDAEQLCEYSIYQMAIEHLNPSVRLFIYFH